VSGDVNYEELARSTDDFNAAQLKAVAVEVGAAWCAACVASWRGCRFAIDGKELARALAVVGVMAGSGGAERNGGRRMAGGWRQKRGSERRKCQQVDGRGRGGDGWWGWCWTVQRQWVCRYACMANV